MMSLATEFSLFAPNNHSEFKISFRPVSTKIFEEVARATRLFDLGEAREVSQVEESERNSNNYRVKTESGEFLLRRNIANGKEKLLLEHEILAHCLNSGSPVSEPLRSSSQEECVDVNGNWFSAYRFISGDHYAGSFAELREAARGVAMLHEALSTLPRALSERISSTFIFLTKEYSEVELDELCRLRDKNPDDQLSTAFAANEKLIRDSLLKINTDLNPFAQDRQILHGDLHPHNLLFDNTTLRAILDFGEMREGPVLEDVAYVIHRLTRQLLVHREIQDESEIHHAVRSCKEIFLETYNSVHPLPREISCEIAPMIARIALKKLMRILEANYQHRETKWNFDFEKHLSSLLEARYFE